MLRGGNGAFALRQLEGLRYGMGFFLGLLGRAITDSPGQGSD